jgi:3-oxoacyl-[acyl-carrier protein] reductase
MTVSLITGVGAKGQVGETVAHAIAQRGDVTLVVSRNASEVDERVSELRAAGARASGYACDLSDVQAVAELAARVTREHGGRLDNLVNLAGGFALSGPVAESDVALASRMWSINFLTAYLTTRALFPLLAASRGSIVYFASESVLEGAKTKGQVGYASAKSAVVALMRSAADEGRPLNVRANALAPASIRTASNEAAMGSDVRYVEREEVAGAVAFLCSPASQAVTGQVIRLS